MIGSPIAGAIYNISGGYDLSFYVAGKIHYPSLRLMKENVKFEQLWLKATFDIFVVLKSIKWDLHNWLLLQEVPWFCLVDSVLCLGFSTSWQANPRWRVWWQDCKHNTDEFIQERNEFEFPTINNFCHYAKKLPNAQ